ncbi:saccharopine dehydrogenase family protein [Natronorubrum sp. FCH18a]|uniref:saccharopine dehydrogenase family protein n=1 Tax=Natronorubrum sp. FCH18a TaxID=3447018 RepID=UPI003F519BA4
MTGKTVVLGGSGAMASGCVYDLYKTSDFDEVVIADFDEENSRRLLEIIDDDRFSYESVDATDTDDLIRVLEDADYVVNGLPYQFEDNVLDAIEEVGGISGVDLNAFDFDQILDRSDEFAAADNELWFANGGLVSTIALGMLGCQQFDEVDEVNFYWGMLRLLTQTTPGLTDTVTYEHDPNVDERAKWVDGAVVNDLPAFSQKRQFEFPSPIGERETYVISHPEPVTFPKAPIAQETDINNVITRGVWHDEWKRYEQTLHAMNAFDEENEDVLETLQDHVKSEGQRAEQWGDPDDLLADQDWTPQTILSVEVTGTVDEQEDTAVFHLEQPYPFFDGNEITTMREYGIYVGVPMSVTLQLMAAGETDTDGVFITETSGLDPERYFEEMEARGFDLVAESVPEDATTPTASD